MIYITGWYLQVTQTSPEMDSLPSCENNIVSLSFEGADLHSGSIVLLQAISANVSEEQQHPRR